jgi:predicted ATPase
MFGTLGIVGPPAGRPLEGLVAVLAGQQRLVILDNCEHVLAGSATLAEALCRQCPRTVVLATSREPLGVDGEVVYPVPPLSVPGGPNDDPAALAASGAVALFCDRVRAQLPGFDLTGRDASLVVSVCRRLDGMPLALELAAARLGSMSLGQLNDRLSHRFRLLTSGSRTAVPRHQTLQATVDWSYDLLSEPERAVFRRASVFVDGFDRAAAEAVCGSRGVPRGDIAALLASLVDKSLVLAEPRGATSRYRLLETLRQYGIERLAEVERIPVEVRATDRDRSAVEAHADREGDAVAAHADRERDAVAAHADHYFGLAERAAPELTGSRSREWLRRLHQDEANLLAAIRWSLDSPAGARRTLDQFWAIRRYWADADQPARSIALLEDALDQAGPDLAPLTSGRALVSHSYLLSMVDRDRALEAALGGLRHANVAEDALLRAEALARCCHTLLWCGRVREALDRGADAVALARETGDPVLLGRALFVQAAALEVGHSSDPTPVYREALALVELTGDEHTASRLHNDFAVMLLGQGGLTDARRHFEITLDLMGGELTTQSATTYLNLGWVRLREGDAGRATSHFTDVMATCRRNGLVWLLPYAALGLACCATHDGELERAAILHGGADALLPAVVSRWEPPEEQYRHEDLARLDERMGAAFGAANATGRAMTLEQVAAFALRRSSPVL